MNIFNIERAFRQKKEKGWDKIYWAIDLHETIIEGKYNLYNVGAEIYPYAQQVLQYLYSRSDQCLILWTSSKPEAIKDITERLKHSYGIYFHYTNMNPECPNNNLCHFDNKFYFNILIDDKGSFEGATDWKLIKDELIRIGEWKV